MTPEELEDVLEVLNRIHRSGAPVRGFRPGGFDEGDVSMNGDERGQSLLRRATLPELEVPRLGVGERPCAMGLERLPARLTSCFEVTHD
jgi:hypothetical protein